MKVLKNTVLAAALLAPVVTSLAVAHGAQRQTPPAQNPPAQPPAAAKPAAEPAAPKPFPEGAKVAYIFMQGLFNNSADGKAAATKLQEWEKKKTAEIQEKTKQAQAAQAKLQQGAGVMNDQARSQAEKELQKLQRELQNMQEDAQQEGQDLRQQLLGEFSKKVNPLLEQVAKEKGLHMVFTVNADANIAWADPGLDLTPELVKRLGTAKK
jgi:outer membrane protein